MQLKVNPPFSQPCRFKYKAMDRPLKSRPKLSIEEPPILELKPLPYHLKYAFLEKHDKLPIIISSSLIEL